MTERESYRRDEENFMAHQRTLDVYFFKGEIPLSDWVESTARLRRLFQFPPWT